MLKWAAAGLGATGLTAVSVGGYYLARGSGQTKAIDPRDEESENLKKKTGFGVACESPYTDSQREDSETQAAVTKVTWGEQDVKTFLEGATHGEGTSVPRVCVMVEYNRKEDSGQDKWTGYMTWIWTYLWGNRGFVSNGVVKPTESGDHLQVEAVLFFLEKNGNVWTKTKQKDGPSGLPNLSKENLVQYFPASYADLQEHSIQKYWGFMEGVGDLNKLCAKDACKDAYPKSTAIHTLIWQPGGTTSPYQWSESMNWWDNLHGFNFSLPNGMESRTGQWIVNTRELNPEDHAEWPDEEV